MASTNNTSKDTIKEKFQSVIDIVSAVNSLAKDIIDGVGMENEASGIALERAKRTFRNQLAKISEWIDKLNQLGFSLPEIKAFVSSFESIESASDLMSQMGTLYQEKLLEVQQQIVLLQQLAIELEESIRFTDQCKPCHLRVDQSDCSNCTLHGHEPTRIPILIAGVQESLQHSHD